MSALAADSFQPHTWYAGSGGVLFRSLNDGEGWEPAGRFEGERCSTSRCTRAGRASWP